MTTKLNYKVNLPSMKEEEQSDVKSSLNALSKQSVINQSLASRMPTNSPMSPNPTAVQTTGFGRTI